jgi:hypothetical protein
VLEDNADILKQQSVNAFLLEKFVDIGSTTMQFACKPDCGPVLPA